jgi:hypothetical protein
MIIDNKNKNTSHNRIVYVRRLRRLGLRKTVVRLCPLCGFFSATFMGLLKLLRSFFKKKKKSVIYSWDVICHLSYDFSGHKVKENLLNILFIYKKWVKTLKGVTNEKSELPMRS